MTLSATQPSRETRPMVDPIKLYFRAGYWLCDEGGGVCSKSESYEHRLSYAKHRAGQLPREIEIYDQQDKLVEIIPAPRPDDATVWRKPR